jgi:hypothetical protein
MRALPLAPRGRLLLAALLAGLGQASPGPLAAQSGVQVRGSATINGDMYSQSGLVQDRKPGQSGIINGSVSITLPGGIEVPLSFFLSNQSSGFQHPFNQVGASPRWSWGGAHAGYFSTRLSELTLADARLLGAGVELNPGPLRLAVVSGLSQRASQIDSILGRPGLFQQRLTAVQAGLGSEGGAMLWLTGMHAEDDPASRPLEGTVPGSPKPQENVVASVRFAVPVAGVFSLEGEVAGSAYSEDIRADTLDQEQLQLPSLLTNLFTPRTSSRADLAGTATVRITPSQTFDLGLTGRYVGPGYRSLGSNQLETDVLDVLVSPSIRLPKASASASVGLRKNNLADTRLLTTNRTIVRASGMVRPTNQFSVSAQLSNYGVSATSNNDTLRIQNVSRSLSVTPMYAFRTGLAAHSASVSLSYQDFTDENPVTGATNANSTTTTSATHTLVFPAGLSFTTAGTLVTGTTGGYETEIFTVGETVGTRLLQQRLSVTGNVSYTRTVTTQLDTGVQGGVRLVYRLPTGGQINASTQIRRFDYQLRRNGVAGYTEVVTRVGYTISF